MMTLSMPLPLHYRLRDMIAAVPSVLLVAVLIIAGISTVTKIASHPEPTEVKLSLITPEPVPAPPVPQPPLPQVTPKQVTPAPAPKPQPVVQKTQAVVAPTPAHAQPAVEASAPAQPVQTPVASAPAPAPVAAPAPAPKANTANAENTYTAQLRAHINSIKRYPTGREASQQRPQGVVKVWFVLRRNGSVVDVGVEGSSHSMILDNAARTTINRATFSGFPDDAWTGQDTHRFTADLEYIPA